MSTNVKIILSLVAIALIIYFGLSSFKEPLSLGASISQQWTHYYSPSVSPSPSSSPSPSLSPSPTLSEPPTETETPSPTPTETVPPTEEPCPEEQCPTPTPTDDGCESECETPTPTATPEDSSRGSSGGGGGSIPKCSAQWLTLVHPNDPDCVSPSPTPLQTATPIPTGGWFSPTPTPGVVSQAGRVETGSSSLILSLVIATGMTVGFYVLRYKQI